MPADLHEKFKPISHIFSLEQLLAVVQYYCQPPESRAFSSESATNRTPQCRAFSRTLKTEMLNVPLFSGPRGAADTNDWCIINFHSSESLVYSCMQAPDVLRIYIESSKTKYTSDFVVNQVLKRLSIYFDFMFLHVMVCMYRTAVHVEPFD